MTPYTSTVVGILECDSVARGSQVRLCGRCASVDGSPLLVTRWIAELAPLWECLVNDDQPASVPGGPLPEKWSLAPSPEDWYPADELAQEEEVVGSSHVLGSDLGCGETRSTLVANVQRLFDQLNTEFQRFLPS